MNDVLKIRDLVYEETGMYFPDEKQYYFEARFRRRMDALGVQSFLEYYTYLRNGQLHHDEFINLMNELTINETSFFRNGPQFTAFESIILPELIETKADSVVKRLKIWSAGCSSGEEVYTIAMIVDHLKATVLADWQVKIVGTDISQRVLEKAMDGFYTEYSIKTMPAGYRKKYLDAEDGGYRVKDCLRQYVGFKNMNLRDDMSMLFMKGFDVIFCKNVLIYFDAESKRRVIQHFFNDLVTGGYLFIGFSESLFGVDNRLKLIHYPGGMVYRKVAHI